MFKNLQVSVLGLILFAGTLILPLMLQAKTITPPPQCKITGSPAVCQGSTAQWCGDPGMSSYLWNTGATTQCITVSSTGVYTLTITDASGASSTCDKGFTVYPSPACNISGSPLICPGGSTQLCAPAGMSSYQWSTGATTSCITVNSAGVFSVTVVNGNGCSASCSVTTAFTTAPLCKISGSSGVCQGGLVQWCSDPGLSYAWSTGATTQCINLNTSGTYSLTITDGNGCSATCDRPFTVYPGLICNITGNVHFCPGGSTQLCATTASSYLWNTGATTQCINVNTAGTFSVTISDANGCTSTCNVSTSAYPTPVCNISGNTQICPGTSSTLCGPSGMQSYFWNTGETTQCIVVSTAGVYSLTVKDDNGCSGTCSVTTSTYTPPVCSISGTPSFCSGGSTQLCASTAAFYLWNTGATTQCITVNSAGIFSVSITDANGCKSNCSVTTSVYTPPTCAITGNLSFCPGGATQLCASLATSYLWSTGATTQCISVNTAGTFTVTITDANGCTSTCNATTTIYTPPTCAITGSREICSGSSAQWCAAAAPAGSTYTYLWSTGATTQCITVSTGGTRTVTITDQNGCTTSCSRTLTVRALPLCSITGSGAICSGSTTQWCAASAPVGSTYTYLWSTGATTQCITVGVAATYTVTITNQYGCTSTCSKTLTTYTPPTCKISGPSTVCQGGAVQWCADAASSYLWNTGATTQCISINTSGTYTVTVTDANGCSSVCDRPFTVYPNPTCAITGNLSFCPGGATQLCASLATSYLWSTGATTQCISVNTAGTFTVTITDANGCTSTCNATTTIYTPPTCAITGNLSFCPGGATQLCASLATSYLWSTGATTQCISVNTAGTFTVTITDANGCTSTCNATTTIYTPPTCAITGSREICSGTSTQWCAAAAPAGSTYTYLWSTGATTQCITVSTGGTRTVTITDQNGCTTSCSRTLTVRALPVCSITGSGAICAGSTTQWCAASAPVGSTYTYLWSTGATTQCITVGVAATYTVTITNQYGCTSTCSKTLTTYTPPTCKISGPSTVCQGGAVQWCADAASSYLWNTGATTQCISINTSGTYTVTVTDANGCSSVCDRPFTVYPNPTCTITGNLSFCQGGATQLCASLATSYLWSTGATTQCISVNTAGTFTVTITDANGCTSTCNATTTIYTPPTCAITGNLSFCPGGATQLCASLATSYLWSTGATTQCISVNTAGTFTVTITDANGCTSTCNATTTIYTPPTCAITGNLSFCPGGATQLCASLATSYLWNTGATTQCISVNTAGSFTVTITDANGCTSACNATTTIYTPPTCAITGSREICSGSSAQWCAAAAPAGSTYTYLWSTGATTQCITVSTGGTRTVTITDQNGCTTSCSRTLTLRALPLCSITGSGAICSGSTTQWCAASAPVGSTYTYLWSTGATTQCITVGIAATYTVTITNQYGCTSTCSKTLTTYTPPTCKISGPSTVCQGGAVQWCADAASSYLWNTGATTQCISINTSGTYTVTVTDANGCSSVCDRPFTVYPNPTCAITGNLSFCPGEATQLCASLATSYLWSTGATTQCISVNTAGTFTVTITDANGCTSTCNATTTIYTPPTCAITGSRSICSGSSAQWCAAAAPAGSTYTYLWSTGATTQCITVSTGGTRTVTITDQNGCTTSCSRTLTVRALPLCSITGSGAICSGSTTQWCAASAPVGSTYTYLWSTGATTQCITVGVAATYTVTITNQYGCTSTCSKTLTTYTPPTCKISGPSTVCQGGAVQWCADAASSYLWNTGATTQCISINTSGAYTVTVTDANGCSSVCDRPFTVYPNPTCAITGNLSFCPGGATQLCASLATSYLWNTGATTQCISVNTAGTFTVTITDANGCTSTCNATTTIYTPPTCAITGNLSFCPGGATQLCASLATSYLWSTGATTQCISVNTAGTFTVTITDANGCTSTCNATTTIYTPPTCAITGSRSICSGTSAQWCAAAAPAGSTYTYLWSTGATTQCITVSTGGTRTVTITDQNGCTTSCSRTLTVRALPLCSITGSGAICSGSTTQWCAASAPVGSTYTYLWSTGATTQCITVGVAATYTVTITNQYGCTSTCSKTLTTYTPPTCKISGPSTVCQGGAVQWCADAASSYLWNTGATTQCISINTSGTYTVTVTDANGCSSVCDRPFTVYPNPTCAITGNLSFCPGGATQLCASLATSYLWNTGATTQCISVNTAGTFTVTITDANGCTSTCNATTTIYTPPTCAITGSRSICSGSSAQWCAAAAPAGSTYTYLWSTGATTQCITVSTGGTRTVTITDQNGCTTSCSRTLTVRALPLCSITGSGAICSGSTTQWCAASAPVGSTYTYLWSTGATTQCITVGVAATYTVTITNQYGCTSTCSKTLTTYTPPTCKISGPSTVCQGGAVQWCADAASSYLWNTGATTQCISINTSGTYTVTVTDANGCSSVCDRPFTVYPNPTCAITGNLSFCPGGATQLCASLATSYLWNTGATTQCISVNTAGTFTVTITDANGCTSTCNATTTIYTPPTCAITGNLSFCPGGATQLCASLATSYLWSTGATTQCISVNTAGTFTVTITDANGCTSTCNATTTIYTPPTCAITGSRSICSGSSAQWCAAAAPAGSTYTYLWSTGATTQCITVSTGGTRTVTITDQNGCTTSCSRTLTVRALPLCSITGSGAICSGSTTQWCAASAPVGSTYTYLWSTGATTQCITVGVAATYTVTITNQYGCTSTCSKTLTTYTPPTCKISGPSTVCQGGAVQWCADAASSYLWNTGATTQCISINTSGTYTVTVTDANGCSSVCDRPFTVYPNPTCAITGNLSFCPGGATQLCASLATSYLWSTGATTQCISVNTAGTFTVTITDANGCTSTCNATTTIYTPPTCAITGSRSICSGSSAQWCAAAAPAGSTYTYLWSTGATTQCITVSTGGTRTVTITDQNGCTTSCSRTLTVRALPVCSITGSGAICSGSTTQWCAASAPVGSTYTYLWSTGATTQCITVGVAATYTVTITNQYGCTSTCSKTLTTYTPPTCKISGPSTVCQGGAVQWCADAASSYLWNTGATTQCISINTSGTYTVTVTDANGCSSVCDRPFTVYPNPTCAITGNLSFCPGGATQLCASLATSYLWSTGATTQCISVNTAGTFTVTITDANGCTSTCNATTTIYTPPTCAITGNLSFCPGGATQLCASLATSYLWNTGATTQCISVNTAGTFTVTITDANGCTSTCNATTTIYTPPTCAITGNLFFCAGGSTQLCASTAASYLWDNGATTQCISVNTAGFYTVNLTDANGCQSNCTVTTNVYTPPVCTISGNQTFCAGTTTQLCASPGMTGYIWSTGATTSCINVSTAGTFAVTVTDANGCTSSCNVTTTVNTPPTCKISGPATVCQGGSVQWCADASSSYAWSNGATTQCVTLNTSGTYTVTVTDANGCSSVCDKALVVYSKPTPVISGTRTLCPGGFTVLNAGAGYASYVWSTGVTTQSIVVTTAGTFTVTVTNSNGCFGTAQATTSFRQAPQPSILGTTIICAGTTTTLTADQNYSSYLWSTGATTKAINVNSAGVYTVTVTNGVGCSASAQIIVTVNAKPPCVITGNLNPPKGVSTTLCAVAGMSSYLWSNGATTQCITLNKDGIYTVTVTNGNGCTRTCSATVVYPARIGDSGTGESVISGGVTLNVYPNPFSENTTLEFVNVQSSARASIELFNFAGEKVSHLFEGEMETDLVYKVNINAEHMPDGIYICRLICGETIINKRIVVIK